MKTGLGKATVCFYIQNWHRKKEETWNAENETLGSTKLKKLDFKETKSQIKHRTLTNFNIINKSRTISREKVTPVTIKLRLSPPLIMACKAFATAAFTFIKFCQQVKPAFLKGYCNSMQE